ncbi:hypothetical protein N665_1341s0006 [Sinapis alba]|nr:hypothetical protein N665_1341s0006 [Sinapis alba]
MTKANIFAIFMIIFVLGMVANETEGKVCREYITEQENCESMVCAAQCSEKWRGFNPLGECRNVKEKICICNYNC